MPLTRPHHPKAWLALLLALGSASAGLFLAWHYPLAWPLALLLWLGLAGLAFVRWQVLPLLLPALVPLVGFAPWSGWLSFEELDLLVLAVATGGYLMLALGGRDSERAPVWQRSLGWSGLTKVLLALFAASVLLAIWRGGMQAGGWRFGWWQGYHEPMNSLRQGKSLFLLLLLLPLWRAAAARQPLAAPQRLALALQLALAGAALAAVWERLAFTGLLNFSTDYRTTALFWETHVGGAPLDACLALTFPFALAGMLQEQRPRRFVALLALLLLGGYAALATFSRGVYLAVPLGGALCLALLAWQRRSAAGTWRDGGAPAHWPRRAVLLALLLGFGLAAWPLFLGGGYRALLALAGSALLLIAMPPLRLQAGRSQRLIVLMLAAMLAAMAAALFWVLSLRIPKAAYVLDGLVVLGGLGLAWWWRAGLTRHLQACVLAAAVFLSLACAAVVAGHWGGEGALLRAWPTLALLALAWGGLQLLPGSAGAALVTLSWRDRGLLWTGCVLLCGVIATFAGGSYMGDRMETGRHDL
ncbi:MAG TPA: hypothetical protein VJN44_04290, partial [Roseateles sp.]|nr:hypothetical protein [Roseateles sp.]